MDEPDTTQSVPAEAAAPAAKAIEYAGPAPTKGADLADALARIAAFEAAEAQRTAEADAKRAAELEAADEITRVRAKAEDLEKSLAELRAAEKARADAAIAGLPAHIQAIASKLSPSDALAWVAEHGSALATPATGTTSRTARERPASAPADPAEAGIQLASKMQADKIFNLKAAARKWPDLYKAAYPAVEG